MASGPDHWRCRIARVKRKGNIYPYPGVTAHEWPAARQPHADSIRTLRGVLKDAEEGRVHGVALAWVNEEGRGVWLWSAIPGPYGTRIIGALTMAGSDVGALIKQEVELK